MKAKLKETYNKLTVIAGKIAELDFPGMAAEMAFHFTFAMFPFFIFLISIFGLIGSEDMVNRIIQIISYIAPDEIIGLLENGLNRIIESSNVGLLTIGFIIALWTSSNAVNVMLKTINKTYSTTKERPFWKNRLLAIGIIILLAITLFISLNLIVFGKIILGFIRSFIDVPWDLHYSLLLVRWPISFLTLFIIALIVYYVTPNTDDKGKNKLISVIPGSLFFCVFWLLASWLFSLYVENFGRYNETFGILGAFIVLLTWLYLSSFIILTGGAINSEYYEKIK